MRTTKLFLILAVLVGAAAYVCALEGANTAAAPGQSMIPIISTNTEELAVMPLDTIAAKIKSGKDDKEKRQYLGALYRFKPKSEKDVSTLANLATENNGKGVAKDAAFRAIENIGPEDKILEPVFLKMMSDKRPMVQYFAMKNCGRLKSANAKPILLKRLKNLEATIKTRDDMAMIEGNTSSLAFYGKDILPDLLKVAKKTSNKSTKKFISGTMREITDKDAVPAFLEIVKDKNQDMEIRGAAIEMVGKLGTKESLNELTGIYGEEKDGLTKMRLVRSIGRAKSTSAIAFLETILTGSNDPLLRSESAHALGEINDAGAIEALTNAIGKEKDSSVGMDMAYSLKRLTGKDYNWRQSDEK